MILKMKLDSLVIFLFIICYLNRPVNALQSQKVCVIATWTLMGTTQYVKTINDCCISTPNTACLVKSSDNDPFDLTFSSSQLNKNPFGMACNNGIFYLNYTSQDQPIGYPSFSFSICNSLQDYVKYGAFGMSAVSAYKDQGGYFTGYFNATFQ